MKNRLKGITINPAQALVIGFATIILIGSMLLMLPIATEQPGSLSYIDALFTATSAASVTGLVVVDVGSTFTLFGEVVIMSLIQLGGLGFMTFGVLFFILLGKRIGLKQRMLIQESVNNVSLQGVVKLALSVLVISFVIETVAVVILSFRFVPVMGFWEGVYFSIFHSISAFNNAGFGLLPDNLITYKTDAVVNITIAALLIVGGIGFTVILDLFDKRFVLSKLSLHTKMVLSATSFLLVLGTVLIFILEFSMPQTLGPLSWGNKFLSAFFQSATTRTAGFNTLDIAALRETTLFLMILFMFVGASPGSTGSGIKTTTALILFSSLRTTLTGRKDIHLFRRTIPDDLLYRSLAITMLAALIVIGVTFILTITEVTDDFIVLLFETVSAFGTVGLSMGLTPDLSFTGKLVIMATMFIGRIGPLTLGFALALYTKKSAYRYAEEKVLIG